MSNNEDYLSNLLLAIQSELRNKNLLGSDLEQTFAFVKAVDWTQPWILSLIGFHILCFIILIVLRNNHNFLSIYFFILLGLATLTKPLNDFGIKHWQSFSKDPYFNTSGLFIVSVYSFPIILNSLITLMWILKAIVSLFVQTKKLQLKQKIDRQRQKKKK